MRPIIYTVLLSLAVYASGCGSAQQNTNQTNAASPAANANQSPLPQGISTTPLPAGTQPAGIPATNQQPGTAQPTGTPIPGIPDVNNNPSANINTPSKGPLTAEPNVRKRQTPKP